MTDGVRTYHDEVAALMAEMADLLLSEKPNWNLLDRIRQAMDERRLPPPSSSPYGPYTFTTTTDTSDIDKWVVPDSIKKAAYYTPDPPTRPRVVPDMSIRPEISEAITNVYDEKLREMLKADVWTEFKKMTDMPYET